MSRYTKWDERLCDALTLAGVALLVLSIIIYYFELDVTPSKNDEVWLISNEQGSGLFSSYDVLQVPASEVAFVIGNPSTYGGYFEKGLKTLPDDFKSMYVVNSEDDLNGRYKIRNSISRLFDVVLAHNTLEAYTKVDTKEIERVWYEADDISIKHFRKVLIELDLNDGIVTRPYVLKKQSLTKRPLMFAYIFTIVGLLALLIAKRLFDKKRKM